AVRPRALRVSLSETLRSRQLRDCRLTRKGALHSPSHGASGRKPARSPRHGNADQERERAPREKDNLRTKKWY
ncbi:MAG: hypothetical protein F6K22_32605, partial [Okeania sp. SIO2F4]|uniref:hypothetical protein n=1 Tax=Okeania sp. SIO2F4 TaxID=2607790 RepID=UPI00142C3168